MCSHHCVSEISKFYTTRQDMYKYLSQELLSIQEVQVLDRIYQVNLGNNIIMCQKNNTTSNYESSIKRTYKYTTMYQKVKNFSSETKQDKN